MNLVELFCGGGGFSRGAHDAGMNVVAAFDLDPILSSAYPKNFPDTKFRQRDVAELSGTEITEIAGCPIDGVFGGPPCQGFSMIGKRDAADPRRSLLGEFFRIVSELQPRFFVMENVQGLAFGDARKVLEDAEALVSDQYHILGPEIFDAAEFGAPTKRPRIFVIGTRMTDSPPMTREDITAFRTAPVTVQQAIADLLGAKSRDPVDGYDVWKLATSHEPSSYASCCRTTDGTFTGNRVTAHTEKVVERFKTVPPGKLDPVGHHYKLSWTGQCPTLRAGTGADKGSFQSVRPIHPSLPRVITVREGARLQGFPDRHLFHPTIWHSFRMIGNSVSPPMAKAIFLAISARLQRHDTQVAGEADANDPELQEIAAE